MLPKLNEIPKYKCTIPSSGKTVRFRPYLVSEEKVLMMFQESGDIKNALDSIVDLVKNCIDGVENEREFTTFDIDYLFLQIRSKSVGETSEFTLECDECEHQNPYTLHLDDVEAPKPDAKILKKKVKLTDEYTIELKYPSYSELSFDEEGTPDPISWVASCISALCSKTERTSMQDETIEEVISFVSNLTSKQFSDVLSAVEIIPSVKYDAVFNCGKCQTENTKTIEGLNSFF